MKLIKILFVFFITLTGLSSPCLALATKIIYITSDDGPLRGSAQVIDVATQKKVPITMFMVGLHYHDASASLRERVDLAKKNPFIQIASHSYSHAYNHYRHFYHDTSDVIADLKRNNRIFGFTGTHVDTRLPGRDVFRSPIISRDDPYISKAEDTVETIGDNEVYKNGFYLYGWDLEWAHDSHGKPIQSVDKLLQEVDEKFNSGTTVLPNKLILLMHDEMFQDHFDGVENLSQLIDLLRKRGYKFDFIKNYYVNERSVKERERELPLIE